MSFLNLIIKNFQPTATKKICRKSKKFIKNSVLLNTIEQAVNENRLDILEIHGIKNDDLISACFALAIVNNCNIMHYIIRLDLIISDVLVVCKNIVYENISKEFIDFAIVWIEQINEYSRNKATAI